MATTRRGLAKLLFLLFAVQVACVFMPLRPRVNRGAMGKSGPLQCAVCKGIVDVAYINNSTEDSDDQAMKQICDEITGGTGVLDALCVEMAREVVATTVNCTRQHPNMPESCTAQNICQYMGYCS